MQWHVLGVYCHVTRAVYFLVFDKVDVRVEAPKEKVSKGH